MLGFSLGVRVSPGYVFREEGVDVGNRGHQRVHASLAIKYLSGEFCSNSTVVLKVGGQMVDYLGGSGLEDHPG